MKDRTILLISGIYMLLAFIISFYLLQQSKALNPPNGYTCEVTE